ncbi:gephyrin-like molybdotransferase Glp [Uliginosibacterium sp. H3]|uniref:Molybdopterin molybdenumtransferase n=1 Tax=Uliginosibacterium silvisoli TaxID=3114758 RepID=A0ABU6K6D8_9RHOO|nr:gephyrin-like molybdotransferase Glp [Uliginosibacterium sp. H3]
MLSFEEARTTLVDAAQPSGRTERVELLYAAGRVLAEDVLAGLNVPPADNSAMDGYAVRAADVVAEVALPISQRVPAGSVPQALLPGTAARIFTGAQIPLGADAVVMQERCVAEGDSVRFALSPQAGDNIRRMGEDIRAGCEVLKAGTALRSQELGLLASLGVAQVTVFARLRVAVFFTGDELRMPGESLPEGQIYNSNRFVLRGLLEEMGCEIVDLGIVRDDLQATREALRQAARDADLILTCGGVSVGEEDHVKAAVEAEGALQSWRVAIRPGKPLAFGRVADTPFIGLPGNPVSSFATFQMLVRPYLRRLQGRPVTMPVALSMRADFSWKKSVPVREFLRVRCNAAGGLDLFPNQGSGVLTSTTWADGFVENPPETLIAEGDLVRYLSFASL